MQEDAAVMSDIINILNKHLIGPEIYKEKLVSNISGILDIGINYSTIIEKYLAEHSIGYSTELSIPYGHNVFSKMEILTRVSRSYYSTMLKYDRFTNIFVHTNKYVHTDTPTAPYGSPGLDIYITWVWKNENIQEFSICEYDGDDDDNIRDEFPTLVIEKINKQNPKFSDMLRFHDLVTDAF